MELDQERWFLVSLGVSILALAYVLSPFLYTFAVAGVLVVVTWNRYEALARRLGGRRRSAAVVSTLAVVLCIALPVATVLVLAGFEGVALVQRAVGEVTTGAPDDWFADLQARYGALVEQAGLEAWMPTGEVVADHATAQLEALVLEASRWAGSAVPWLLGALWRSSVDLVVFCMALFVGYVRGPAFLDAVRSVLPLRRDYVDRLFGVFRQFALNVALGMVAAGAVQGVVATVGFWLAGVPGELVLGLVTAVTSVVPIVGSAVIWVPVAVGLALQGSWGAAVFVTVWSAALTASADNVVKPLLYRSNLQVSPVLMLLALFGGLLVMGAQGLVFGPSVLVLTLTLYTLYQRDFVRADEGAEA